MSRIIELSNTEIKKPNLLEAAVAAAAQASGQTIEGKFTRDKDGNIVGGVISIPDPTFTHADLMRWKERNPAEAKRMETKFPGYFLPRARYCKSVLRLSHQNGNVTLTGDEDYTSNQKLAELVSDHYQSLVVKETLEAAGHYVEITVGDDGAIQVDGYEEETGTAMVAGY